LVDVGNQLLNLLVFITEQSPLSLLIDFFAST
jgi:hypothetical protein